MVPSRYSAPNKFDVIIIIKINGAHQCSQIQIRLMSQYHWEVMTTHNKDEQSILFETSRPNRLFSEPTLTLRDLHMVVPASLLVIYSFF